MAKITKNISGIARIATGSPDAVCAIKADTNVIAKPADAHSLILELTGVNSTIPPISLAMANSILKYEGKPK